MNKVPVEHTENCYLCQEGQTSSNVDDVLSRWENFESLLNESDDPHRRGWLMMDTQWTSMAMCLVVEEIRRVRRSIARHFNVENAEKCEDLYPEQCLTAIGQDIFPPEEPKGGGT